ncbi:hypothetical protein CC85DRAFT_313059 [Cutaneotrichosporon oleaginosum]|uniref:Mannosyltransferase putative-domain-containing protein n=1 Tax=Cutaneotrichosporon oleaginosum TaxID=879819 RepID=A0A0J0XIQ2_9TREE|nr:uncharacterized protein CC85DRAFT_313059 [Cutaneotrichosporon oleaginosum]KLT40948.1 hypothetical protein CC85DRAFT_313059 [Cutaneotrichosporon oleaginosum]TXT15440.1 hypothetical protein COLE_01633 [Cutaneotrichosporon oleaginosum]
MSTAYSPVNAGRSGGVASGIRMRVRPLHLILMAGIALIIGLPLLAGSERRDNLRAYIAKTALGGSTLVHPSMATHVAPPSGGIPDADGVPLTLEARLINLVNRPALDHWEAELPNRYACPMFTFARVTYFFHEGKDPYWHGITKDQVRSYRQKMVDYFRELDRKNVPLVWDRSMENSTPRNMRRGIIYTGSGVGKDLARMTVSLHFLRNVVKSKLPVEIYHYPGEFDNSTAREELTRKYNVDIREVSVRKTDGKTWLIKNTAFIESKFTQFVYMDSDNYPLADPEELFESVEFKQSGSVFWADLNKDHPDNAIWRILGRTCSDEQWPAESGQVVFDKSGNNGLNLAVLHLSNHMMDNNEMYGNLGYGDKDTYRYAFYALGLNYQQAPRLLASVGGYQRQDGTSSPDYFCGHSMIQWGLTPPRERHNPEYHPKPAFLHTILLKHRYGLQPSRLFSHTKRPRADFILDPRLVRTLYEFTGDCFAITLKGPDGLPGEPNSVLDGQGVIVETTEEVLSRNPGVWKELDGVAAFLAGLNIPGT